ncbi:hypothetical protein [Colwellia sp. E150_009]
MQQVKLSKIFCVFVRSLIKLLTILFFALVCSACSSSSSELTIYENCFTPVTFNADELLNIPKNEKHSTLAYYFFIGEQMSKSEKDKLAKHNLNGYILQGVPDEWSSPILTNTPINFIGYIALNKSSWLKAQVGLKDNLYFVITTYEGKFLLESTIGLPKIPLDTLDCIR